MGNKMIEKIKKDLTESSYIKLKISQELTSEIELAAKWILESYQEGGRLILFGNGGSAADAQHIAVEFVNYFRIPERPMLDCLALTTNTSILTSIANDTSYDNVFSKQIESLVNCKDVVLGLSTSGNSKNVIKGLEMAKKRGAKTILFTGQDGGKASLIADLSIKVPSKDTPRIQEAHITIGHIICDIVEHELFKDYLPENKKEIIEASSECSARINFGNGGDTDYYINKLGWGAVINTTLNSHKYICTLKRTDEDKIKVTEKNTFYEGKDESKINSEYFIRNLETESKKDLIAATINEIYSKFKGEVIIETNIPRMSGLGGSSSLQIALINSLFKIQGKKPSTPMETAYLAYDIERNIIGIKGGYQDQFASAFSNGFNYMEFKKEKSTDKFAKVIINPLSIESNILQKIEDSFLLFYLSSREISGSESHAEQAKQLMQNEEEITKTLFEKRENVLEIRDALPLGEIEKIGRLLHKDYELKKKLSNKITNNFIKEIYELALSNGAYGGKISGAGAGGCLFLICDKNEKDKLIKLIEERGGVYMPCKLTKGD